MANDLTGDFDVVAEFSILAVDRMLAAMHQAGRFLHSISVDIDDKPHPSKPGRPTMVGIVDGFGEAVVNQKRVTRPEVLFPGVAAATDPAYSNLSPLVNPDALVATIGPIVPSQISGSAQLQIFPPTIAIPDASGENITVRMNVMARYFPDPNTAPLAEFVRGDLQITASVDQIASERSRVIDVNFKADNAIINFTPSWSSKPLSAEDIAGIDLCIRNGLRTSFLPSSVPLPASISRVGFKTLPGAVSVMLNLNDHPSTDASVSHVFLGGGDDFAFAVSRDYLHPIFNSVTSNIQFEPISVDVPIWGHATYTNSFTSTPTLTLQDGAIVLTVHAHAHSNKSRFPSFNFTATIAFALNLVAIDSSGRLGTAELALADVALDFTDSGVEGWGKDLLLGLFRGHFIDNISDEVNKFLNPTDPQPTDLQPTIRQMMNVDTNLGNLLNSMLIPSRTQLIPQRHELQLAYKSVEIRPWGVVLHGSVSVVAAQSAGTKGRSFFGAAQVGWPPPHVEFEQIPAHAGSVINPIEGPDYSALKSWIPGGTIAQYEWSTQGYASPFDVEANKFVLIQSPVATTTGVAAAAAVVLHGYTALCLTVRGTRISPSGTEVFQPVSSKVCGYSRIPVISSGLATTLGAAVPALALTQPRPDGSIEVVGHTTAQLGQTGNDTPNLIIHFADAKSATRLDLLTEALDESGRNDASAAVIALLTVEQLAKIPYTPGVIYGDEQDKSWNRLFGSNPSRPLTVIVSPNGKVLWQHAGPVERAALVDALKKYLVKTGPIALSIPRLNIRLGQPAPNFLFEFAPGRELPVRKLAGSPVMLVFWRSSSPPSLGVVNELQKTKGARVLAINDGESAETAKSAAEKAGFAAILVSDPKREISTAYGVEIWPTTVSLDSSGVVTGIRYGNSSTKDSEPTVKQAPEQKRSDAQ